ncbi:DinB family protein [Alicyclobacillus sp. SP_1]|uniref:DinB family protein n=1 Tax=Alicyclobacillus sp. SP_1 TaxID=2942475 RepID=UPI00215819DD|nr:DinB family protein [Alicyclobacillus sp. SP_1]
MVREVQDIFELLTAVHRTMDGMVEDLTDEQWMKKPLPNFNNIVSVFDHVNRVEARFLSILSGAPEAIDTQLPFHTDTWDLKEVRDGWSHALMNAEQVFSSLTVVQLEEEAVTLGIGKLNKRQLLGYMVAHTAHHRGQIPLIKKLLLS